MHGHRPRTGMTQGTKPSDNSPAQRTVASTKDRMRNGVWLIFLTRLTHGPRNIEHTT
jgi:hypothetical protein